ncbi:MAG: hypothetical protein HRU75_00320 [Planctomycetia bacterium]|nr:MAG: hypothetical protein HRU75_00320 [Planctomycetia bacterium]
MLVVRFLGPAALAAMLCASAAVAEIFPEVEPNDRRAAPQVVDLQCGDGITGVSTGLDSFLNPGPTTVDHYLLRTPAPLGQIQRYELHIPPPNRSFTLRGRTPESATADVSLQSAFPAADGGRYVAWYGLGAGSLDQMDVRFGGDETTTDPYVATLTCSSVMPVLLPAILPPGSIRAAVPSGGNVVLFDSLFTSAPGWTANSFTLTFSGGEYLLGVSTAQIYSPGSAAARTAFPGMTVAPSSASNTTVRATFSYGAMLAQQLAIDVPIGEGPAIGWVRFYVAGSGPGACCIADGCNADMTVEMCAAAGGVFLGGGVPCVLEYCPRACCYGDGDCRALSALACAYTGGQPQALGTSCETAQCPAPLGSGCINPIQLTVPAQLPYTDTRNSCGMSRSLNCAAQSEDVVYRIVVTEPVCLRATVTAPGLSSLVGASMACPPCGAATSGVVDPIQWQPGVHWIAVRPSPCGEYTLALENCAPRACCFIDGSCQELLPAACAQAQGSQRAAGVACSAALCPPAMTCCMADGTCRRITEIACGTAGGRVYSGQPDCTPELCSEVRSCCLPGGGCVEAQVVQCFRLSGSIRPAGTPCPADCVAVCLWGDVNCDGVVNNFDIDQFILALVSSGGGGGGSPPTGWTGTAGCWQIVTCTSDINRDQQFNSFDIDPFITCIVTLPSPGDPCPGPGP